MKLDKKDEAIATLKAVEVPNDNFMIPGCVDMADMKIEEYAMKYEEGPDAVLTVFANVEMGRITRAGFRLFSGG